MTKEQKALKLALEALEGVLDDAPKVFDASISGGTYEVIQCRDAITAIKEALEFAQPAQPAQEPVAIALNTGTKQGVKWLKNVEHGENLYTTPQPRPWVGLTDDEIADAVRPLYGTNESAFMGVIAEMTPVYWCSITQKWEDA